MQVSTPRLANGPRKWEYQKVWPTLAVMGLSDGQVKVEVLGFEADTSYLNFYATPPGPLQNVNPILTLLT